MSEVMPFSEEERASQQALSERPATIEERNNVGGIEVQSPKAEVSSEFNDAEEDAGPAPAMVLEAEAIAMPSATSVISDWAQANEVSMVRVNVTGTVNFVLDMFCDEVNDALEQVAHVEIGGTSYNLIQPLNKFNERNNRIGLLTDRVRDLLAGIGEFDNLSTTVMLPVDFADDAINNLVEQRANAVVSAMFDGLPVDEVTGESVIPLRSGDFLPASRVFFPSFRTAYSLLEEGSEVNVTIEAFIRIRVPVLLRTESDKVESTLIRYAKHLVKLASNAQLQSEVFMIFRSSDLFKEPVWNLLNIVRDNFEDADLFNEQEYSADEHRVFQAPGLFDPVFGQGDILIGLSNELARREGSDE